MYFYLRKYLLLVVLACLGFVVATVECVQVDPDEARKRSALKLLERIDQPGSYYQFKIEMYPDRAQTEFLVGLERFKQSQNILKKSIEAKSQKQDQEAKELRRESLELLKEARVYFESALERGHISNKSLHDYYAISLKYLYDLGEVTREEVQQAVDNRLKHFPLSELPPQLKDF